MPHARLTQLCAELRLSRASLISTHTPSCCAGKIGHLYPSGDYVEAARLIRALIEDPTACKAMASAGRAEVEKFGWSAATKVLREQQYSRAIKVNSSKQR